MNRQTTIQLASATVAIIGFVLAFNVAGAGPYATAGLLLAAAGVIVGFKIPVSASPAQGIGFVRSALPLTAVDSVAAVALVLLATVGSNAPFAALFAAGAGVIALGLKVYRVSASDTLPTTVDAAPDAS